MKFTYEGKEYEFRGTYRATKAGDHFLTNDGTVLLTEHQGHRDDIRAIVHPVEVLHTFGGVVFRETGEVRTSAGGEWVLLFDVPVALQHGGGTSDVVPILEPIRIEKEN